MKYRARSKLSFWRWSVLILSVLLLFTLPCFADITEDLKPLDGYVVMVRDGEVIIDLDGQRGIAPGDIFSVVGPGKELIHPVTKKVIGRLEESKAILRIVKTDKGFSHARSLGDPGAVKRGDRIRRFSSLTAVFWDYTEKNRELFDHLQTTLTSLKWQDYRESQINRPAEPSLQTADDATLYFIAHQNILEIRDGRFNLIRHYSLDDAATGDVKAAQPVGKSTVAYPDKPQPEPAQTSAAMRPSAVVRYDSVEGSVGLPDNTITAALLQYGDMRLVAAADGKKISVFKEEKKLELLAEGRIQGYGQIFMVKWWQPAAGGPLYLAVLAWTDDAMDSTIFVFDHNRLTIAAGGLNTILGSFDLDNDGRPETLLSQEFNAETYFGRRIKEMYWHNSQLEEKKFDLELPSKFTVIGGVLADLTGDGRLEAVYVRRGILWIYSGKKRLYASSKHMGGSLSVLTYKVDPTLLDYRTTSVFFEVAPVAADIDGDGRRELLAVSSDQSSIRAPGFATTIDKSRIMVFNFEKGNFIKGTVGDSVEAAIQGLDVDDRRVLLVTTDIGGSRKGGGASRLQTVALPE